MKRLAVQKYDDRYEIEMPGQANEESRLLGVRSSSFLIPIIAVAATVGLVAAALKATQVKAFTKSVDVSLQKTIFYKTNPITEGIRMGVALRIKNPTNQSYSFQHPSVEMGTLSMNVLQDSKTGEKRYIPDFKKYLLSNPEPTIYTIPAAGEVITKPIIFELSLLTCIQLFGTINWGKVVQTLVSKSGSGLKSLFKAQSFAIKPRLYASGLPLPIELPAFYMFR